MDLLKRAAAAVLGVVPRLARWGLAQARGVWHEIVDGHHRLSWYLLLALVWLDGVIVAWWMWVR